MNTYFVKEILHYCNISVENCSEILPSKISYYDLTFVLSGSLTYILDGQKYILYKNDAILAEPNTIRERLEGNTPVSYVSFNFLVNEALSIPSGPFLKNIISSDVKSIISLFAQEHISQFYHSKEKLTNILNYILIDMIDMVSAKCNNKYIIEITKYIGENVSKPITLKDISNHIHLTKEYTAYLFKKEMHTTVVDFIHQYKMMIAKDIIRTTQKPLTDIAKSLGYQTYSYFSKVFKKYFNTSPVRFRIQSQSDKKT